MRDHFSLVAKNFDHLSAYLDEEIEEGMVSAYQSQVLGKTESSENSIFKGGVFYTIGNSPILNAKRKPYAERLRAAEMAYWPTDEFIGMGLLGVIRIQDEKLAYQTQHRSLVSLEESEIAVVYVFCSGQEPIRPEKVTNAFSLIAQSVGFFGRFLEESSANLAEFSRALMKSAVSAIMARNMSHNIGSHVSLEAKIDALHRRLDDFYPDPPKLSASKKLRIITGLRTKFDQYLQEKADFLAEITTEPLTTTKAVRLYREIIVPLIANTILIDALAANESVRYRGRDEPRIVVRVFWMEQEVKVMFASTPSDAGAQLAITYPPRFPYTGYHPNNTDFQGSGVAAFDAWTEGNGVKNEFGDLWIEVPGPLGEHAFFSLLENLIRNSAKHNRNALRDPAQDLEVCIRITENPHDCEYFQVQVYDNLSNPLAGVKQEALYNPSVAAIEEQTLSSHINRILNEPLVGADGHLRKSSWGLAEMRICATLLAGSTDFARQSAIVASTEKIDGTSRLVYTFRLMKPRKVCAVVQSLPDQRTVSELLNKGIYLFQSLEALTDFFRSASRSPASFRFFVLDKPMSSSDSELLDKVIQKLPFRCIASARTTHNGNLNCSPMIQSRRMHLSPTVPSWSWEATKIEHWCWSTWCQRWITGDPSQSPPAEANLSLQQELTEMPTQRWHTLARAFNDSSQNSGLRLRIWTKNEKGDGLSASAPTGVCFDRHGDALGDGFEALRLRFLETNAYVLLDKNNADFAKLYQPAFPIENAENWTLPYEMLEAGLLRIAILDERLAESSLHGLTDSPSKLIANLVFPTKNGSGVRVWHVAYAAKVYVCTHLKIRCCMDAPEPLHVASYEKARQDVSCPLPFMQMQLDTEEKRVAFECRTEANGPTSTNLDPIDVLIVHQGVLEQIQKSAPIDAPSLLRIFQQNIPFIVVDSGRGVPPALSETVKFLPFSLLGHYVGGNRVAKFSLSQVVMALSRRSTEEAHGSETIFDHRLA